MPILKQYGSTVLPTGLINTRPATAEDFDAGASAAINAGNQVIQGRTQLAEGQLRAGEAQAQSLEEGAKVGDALIAVGKAQDILFDKADKARRAATLAKANTDAATSLQEYAWELKNGHQNPDGTQDPPSDPSTHYQLFQKRVDDLSTQYQKTLDPASFSAFTNNLKDTAMRQSIDVRNNAIQKTTDVARADLDSSLDRISTNVPFANSTERPKLIAQAQLAIQDQVRSGTVTAQEGQQKYKDFQSNLVGAEMRKRIYRGDPDQAFMALTSGPVQGLDPKQQEHYIEAASRESDRMVNQAVRRMDLQDRLEKKAKVEADEVATKDMSDAIRNQDPGVLDKLEENRDALSGERYKMFSTALSKDEPIHRNPDTFTALLRQAGQVKSDAESAKVLDDASAAVTNREMKTEDFTTIFKEAQGARGKSERPSWYHDGFRYIDLRTGGDKLEFSQDTADLFKRKADAFTDWSKWTDAHPDAKPVDREAEFRRIGDNAVLTPTTTIGEYSKFLVGTYDNPNFDQSFLNLKEARAKGSITLQELKDEAGKLDKIKQDFYKEQKASKK